MVDGMDTDSVYPAGPIKRRRGTRDQIEQLERQIVAVLEEDHPQSVRHVFYRMTDPRLPEPVEKYDNGSDQVGNRLIKMRREGRIPYDWISDATRTGYHVNAYKNAADFIESMAGQYRADIWTSSPFYVEVWCESRSIAGIIQADCQEMGVSLYPAAGFSSLTLCYDAAKTMNYYTDNGEKEAHILYIGDYDPAGVLIDVSIEREIRQHLHENVELEFHRLGINPVQIEKYDLPTKPRKRSDRRSRHVKETVEAEAMQASILRDLLREAIESYLDPRALAVAKVAEESERFRLIEAAINLGEDGE
jgi:hypothetical protein